MIDLSVAQALIEFDAGQLTLKTPVTIIDSLANVLADFDALQAMVKGKELVGVKLTGSSPFDFALSYTQYQNDNLLVKLIEKTNSVSIDLAGVTTTALSSVLADHHVSSFTIADTATNLLNKAAAIRSAVLTGRVAAVSLSANATGLTVAKAETLTELPDFQFNGQTMSISDSLKNITAAFAQLEQFARSGVLGTITITNAGTQSLFLTATQALTDVDVLTRVVSGLTIVVTDSAANVVTCLDALESLAKVGHLGLIVLTGSTAPVLTLTARQLSADGDALHKIAGHYAIAVSDSAADVAANLGALEALAAAGTLTGIALTDSGTPTLILSETQYTNDSAALALIGTTYQLDITNALAADAAGIAAGANVVSIAVSDSAADVAASLDALETLAAAGTLTSIALTDSGTPTLTLGETQYTNDGAALALIGTPYQIDVTGVLAADATSIAVGANVVSIAVNDSAADVAASLDALETLAAAGTLTGIVLTDSGTPTLTLSETQYAGDDAALVLIGSPYQLDVTNVLAADAAGIAAGANVTSVAVSDSAADVGANLGALETLAAAGTLTGIALTDGGTPTLDITETQYNNDSAALGLIGSPYQLDITNALAADAAGIVTGANVTSVAVSDSAADVAASLDALETLAATGVLASIALTDSGTPTFTLSETQYTNDSAALGLIGSPYQLDITGALAADATSLAAGANVASIAVSDSAADVGANLDALETLAAAGTLIGIALIDSGTPTLTLSETQYASDSAALALINTPYQIDVTGVLAADATSIAVGANVVSIAVNDSAADIAASLDALETVAAAGTLTGIALTDGGTPTLTLSETQYTNDSAALALIGSPYQLDITNALAADAPGLAAASHIASIAVSDSAADIAASLDALETLAAAGTLTGIALTDGGTPTLTLSETQYTSDNAALGLIGSPYQLDITNVLAADASSIAAASHVATIAVSDNAADVAASLDALETLAAAGTLTGIALTDGGTPTLTLSETQYTSDNAALGLIGSPYQLDITDALAADATNLAASANVISVAVSDSAADVGANLDALETLAATGVLASIALTDSGTPTLDITETQYDDDSAALALIDTPYQLDVTNVLAADASSIAVGANVASVAVSDSAADVGANLDALETLAAAGTLTGIALIDSGTPTLTLSETQYNDDSAALALIGSPYQLDITDALAADAAGIAAGANVASVAVRDNAADVGANLGALETLAAAGTLTGIALTDGGTPTLDITETQYNNDSAALGLIGSPYQIDVTNVLAADAGGIAASANVISVAVSDSAADVGASLDALETLATAGTLTGIALTDSGTPTLTLSETQYANDSAALALIGSPYQLDITNALAADATSLAAGANVVSVAVSDSAADVAASLVALETLATAGTLTGIALTDGGTPTLTISETQYNNDSAALGLIGSPYQLDITGALAADAPGLAAGTNVASVAVSDSAVDVGANLDALETLAAAGTLTGIVLTDSGTPTLTLGETQYNDDSAALALIDTPYQLDITNALAADATSLAAGANVVSVAVSDSAADVAASLVALETLATAGTLTGIALTDGGTPTLDITETQYTNDSAALGLIGSPYQIDVTNVLAADAGGIAASANVISVAVSDSAADVGANLDTLEALAAASTLTGITLTDSGTPTLDITETQYTNDSAALALIGSPYQLDITDALAADASSIAAGANVVSIAVSDNAADVAASLDALETVAASGTLASIALTDGGTPTLDITETQYTNDSAALALIDTPYQLVITGGAGDALARPVSPLGQPSSNPSFAATSTVMMLKLASAAAAILGTPVGGTTTPAAAVAPDASQVLAHPASHA